MSSFSKMLFSPEVFHQRNFTNFCQNMFLQPNQHKKSLLQKTEKQVRVNYLNTVFRNSYLNQLLSSLVSAKCFFPLKFFVNKTSKFSPDDVFKSRPCIILTWVTLPQLLTWQFKCSFIILQANVFVTLLRIPEGDL